MLIANDLPIWAIGFDDIPYSYILSALTQHLHLEYYSLFFPVSCVVVYELKMSEKSISSRSLEGAETLHEREGYNDKDVFGHEEEHDVCNWILTFQR